MTPLARAEKIVHDYCGGGLLSDNQARLLFNRLMVELEEAEREAYKRGEQSQKSCEKSYAEGFRSAREKAKGIAEDYYQLGDVPLEIAQRIANMKEEK